MLYLIELCLIVVPAQIPRQIATLQPFMPSLTTQDNDRQILSKRFLDNYRTDQKVAYEAAKDYLRKYPLDTDDNAQLMRRWVAAYEKVVTGNRVSSQPSASGDSRVPATKHADLGDAHARLQEWSEAEEEYKQALGLEPSNSSYRTRYAATLLKQEKWS